MGIFSRIRGFFCSCIRSSTSSSSDNEENSRLLGSNVDSSQSNSSTHVASTSVNSDHSNRVRNPIDKASISHHESLDSSQRNSSRHVTSTSVNYGHSNRVRNPINKASISHHESFDSLQRNSSRHVASTKTKAALNYGTIRNKVRDSVNKSNTATTEHQFDRPCYFLQTFITSPKSSPKGKPAFTLESDVIYLDEWTTCAAVILDLDEPCRQLSPQHTVELSSDSCVEFRDCKLHNGCLHFSMKALNTEAITIFFNIRKYPDTNSFRLSKKIRVSCNPCSTVHAEMTIQRIDESNGFNTCVFQLSIVDVSGGITSHGSCKLDILSSGENEVIQKKRMVSEAGHIYFEITVRGQQPWSREVVLTFNGQHVPNAQKIEVFDKLKGLCCRALKDGDYESIPDFIEFYGSRVFIPLSVGDDDGKFLPYNEDNCELLPRSNQILCKDTKRDEVLGSGFAHINNIARVLKLKDPLNAHEIQAENIVIIDLSNVHLNCHHICKEVVQHLICGLYYRRKASEAAAVRMEWKNRIATLGKLLGTSPSMRICKIFRDYFGILMNRYNHEACNELFAFFNFHRDVCEVDLHGLYVADEKKLELLRVDLLQGLANHKEIGKILQKCKSFNGRSKQVIKYELLNGKFPAHEVKDFIKCCRDSGMSQKELKVLEKDLLRRVERSKKVDNIIEKFRSEGDEAIRKLKETLESFDLKKAIKNNTPWLEIIVGAGHHSRIKNKQNIRPKVEKLLKERNLKFAAVNKGSLVVTFLNYSGPEPCFGEYHCEKCDRCWKSGKSYVGKYQKCVRCQANCWPVKQREKEKVVNYHREGAGFVKRQPGPHQSSRELGRPCNASNEECVII